MRYTTGTRNNDVTAIVRADGLDCPELGGSSAGSAGQCWIALKSGQTLSVFCDIKLETSQYQVDLVIDGVLRNIVVSTVCPRNEDRGEIVEFFEGNHKHFRSLFRSPMIVSRLPEPKEGEVPVIYDDSDNTRVGTIEVFVYTYDMGFNHTRAAELPENVVDWEDLEGPAGCAGIQPTHEIIMPTTKRLNDTERRTWKNKSEKLPMGYTPWAHFKFLYRHETSLQRADLVDRRHHIVPTADGLSSLSAGLLTFASSPQDGSSFGNNPWVVRERNGLREYKQLDINPNEPGPQIISTKRVPKRPRFSKKNGKKQANRRSSRLDDDLDYDSADGQSKRVKSNLSGLRAEVENLQLERNRARRTLEEQSNSEVAKLSSEEERTLLIAHKEALQCEIKYIALQATKYETRQAALEGENDAVESAGSIGSSDDAMMIDPALLTSESFNSATNDGSVSGDYVTNGRTTRYSARIAAAEKATNSLVITDNILSVNNGFAMGTFPEF